MPQQKVKLNKPKTKNKKPQPKIGSPAFKKLLAKEYRRLKKLGFKDIEVGFSKKDPDKLIHHSSTFPQQGQHDGIESLHSISTVWLDTLGEDTVHDLLQTENNTTARYWDLAFEAVHRLLDTDPTKHFLFDVCDTGNVTTAYRKNNIPRREAYQIWSRFLKDAGLPAPKGSDND